MIKAVIFDMDGLMINSEEISFQCYQDIITSYGYPFTKEDYLQGFPGRSALASLTYIKNHYHLDFDLDVMVKHFFELEQKYLNQNGVSLKNGLIELLEYLKKHQYKTIIATSSTKVRAKQLLGNHDVLKYFDDMICGDEISHSKPDPEIFIKAAQKLQVKNSEALVLEDSEAGIAAANKAGISVICIPDLKYPQKEYLDQCKILDSLDEVINFLKNL